jgi:hypothetical protein
VLLLYTAHQITHFYLWPCEPDKRDLRSDSGFEQLRELPAVLQKISRDLVVCLLLLLLSLVVAWSVQI